MVASEVQLLRAIKFHQKFLKKILIFSFSLLIMIIFSAIMTLLIVKR